MPPEKSPTEIALLEETQHFLRSTVHDLRAAQRRTVIAAELLLQSAPGAEQAELIAQMLQGVSKTDELLTGISRYANALSPTSYSINVFPFSSAVRFALANLDSAIRQTGATISVGDLPDVPGDRDRLSELIEHLIANSLKFRGSAPPAVQISAHSVPEGWLFSIKDNGLGIPVQYRGQLFVPFRRLQGTEVPGAGLGLATSRKIVETHGGRIWIEDQSGPGVTVCFTLSATVGDRRA